MNYEETESGIKILDKRGKVEPPKDSFFGILSQVFLFFLMLFVAIGGIATIGWQINKWLNRKDFQYIDLLGWFQSFDLYVQVIMAGTIALLLISLAMSTVVYIINNE